MKFYAPTSIPIYLSRRGPPPVPLAFFDVYYDSYPRVGFSVVGSSSTFQAQVSILYEPDALAPFSDEAYLPLPADDDEAATSAEYACETLPTAEEQDMADIARYGRQTGELEAAQPMHVPPQPAPNFTVKLEAQIEWMSVIEVGPTEAAIQLLIIESTP